MDRCEHCGAPLPDGAKACPACGTVRAAAPDGVDTKYRQAEFVMEEEDGPARQAQPSPAARGIPEARTQAEPSARAETQKGGSPRQSSGTPPRKGRGAAIWISVAAAVLLLLASIAVYSAVKAASGKNGQGLPAAGAGVAKEAAKQASAWTAEDPSGRFTLSYDGRGIAKVQIRDRGPYEDYSLTAVWLGSAKDGGKNVERDPNRFNRSSYCSYSDGSSHDEVHVIPGGYTKFVYAHDTLDDESAIWESEPYFFAEAGGPLPLTVTDLTFARWDSGDLLTDAMDALSRAPSYDAAPKVVAVPHSSPSAFKATLKDIQYPSTLGYRISYRFDMSSPAREDWFNRSIPFAVAVNGPGFTETYGRSATVFGPEGAAPDVYTADSIRVFADGRGMQLVYDLPVHLCDFFDEKAIDFDYRSGDYTLELYIAGRKAYTLRYALQ